MVHEEEEEDDGHDEEEDNFLEGSRRTVESELVQSVNLLEAHLSDLEGNESKKISKESSYEDAKSHVSKILLKCSMQLM